jgi:hypothetical protein
MVWRGLYEGFAPEHPEDPEYMKKYNATYGGNNVSANAQNLPVATNPTNFGPMIPPQSGPAPNPTNFRPMMPPQSGPAPNPTNSGPMMPPPARRPLPANYSRVVGYNSPPVK